MIKDSQIWAELALIALAVLVPVLVGQLTGNIFLGGFICFGLAWNTYRKIENRLKELKEKGAYGE